MSRSFFTKKWIPRSYFPSKIGGAITCKDGTLLTLGSDQSDVEESFYLTDSPGDEWSKIWLFFQNGFLSMYDMNYTIAWNGTGMPLLNKIRNLTRGQFTNRV